MSHQDRIAVVGMAGRFPGAHSVAQLWRNLCAGVESIARFDADELIAHGVGRDLIRDPAYVPANGVLADVELFDAGFFGFTPREAELTDPQHRVFLECAWEALEDAACDPARERRPIGVYAGAGLSTYLLHHLLADRDVVRSADEMRLLLGNHADYLATRVSYKLNLRGPSLAVGTACSTSLVAIQMACQHLLDYRCDVALAGGISIQLPQMRGYLHTPGGVLSPDGHCRAFDARAQGTVSGNGVGIVVLKRLEDAIEDGDDVRAVILGSGINNDGAEKVGYTAPGAAGQTAAIAQAYADADVSPDTIGYVETHGTGTAVGDPLEIAALTEAFRLGTSRVGFCAIGSVKPNLGHLDEAAGVAGFIKTVLALRHGQIPPSLHFERANPEIDFASTPFVVNTRLTPWPRPDDGPRRAGVSSFGIGGTNVHLVLEEAPDAEPTSAGREAEVLVVSARSARALDEAGDRLARYLDESAGEVRPGPALADVAHTLQVGRQAFAYRRAIVCRSTHEAIEALRAPNAIAQPAASSPAVAFLFPGQGTQHVDMGRELYEAEPVFRDAFDRCAERLFADLRCDLRDLVYGAPDGAEVAAAKLARTDLAQPALFAVEYATATLLTSYGVQPRALIGHSLGEYVAACLAGVWSLDEALSIVALRGRLMQHTGPGAMLSVELSAADAEERLRRDEACSVAAINASSLCVVSGPADRIAALARAMDAEGIGCRALETSRAFHSVLMDPIVAPLVEAIGRTSRSAPATPYGSNLTGTWVTSEQARDAEYWGRHLRQPVRFAANLEEASRLADVVFVEVGPGRSLQSAARRQGVHVSPTLDRRVRDGGDQPPRAFTLLRTLGELWVRGVPVDWAATRRGERRARIALPTYPFERQRFWIEPTTQPEESAEIAIAPGAASSRASRRKNPDVADWFYLPSWSRSLPAAPSRVATPAVAMGRTWLVLPDRAGVARELTGALERDGHRVIVVPSEADLDRALAACEVVPDCVLDARAVSGGDAQASGSAEQLTEDLLRLVQWLMTRTAARDRDVSLILLTDGAHDVTGDEPLVPEHATLLGPLKVALQEYPGLRGRAIDLAWPNPPLDLIAADLAADTPETVVAYRGRHRWTQTYVPVRLDAPAAAPLREGGTYLITGGLGGVGLILADHLARTARANLVLVGRTPVGHDRPADGDVAARQTQTTSGADESRRRLEVAEARAVQEMSVRPLSSRAGLESSVRQLCAAYAREYFERCAIDPAQLADVPIDDLVRRTGVRPAFARFVARLRSLALDEMRSDAGSASRDDTAETQLVRAIAAHPEFEGMFRLLDHCARHYAPALRGDIPAIGVLYRDGGTDLLDRAFGTGAASSSQALCRRLLVEEIVALARQASPARPLRILEVGAGDGILTRQLVPALRGLHVEYCVTDLGRGFVRTLEAEAAAAGVDYATFATFDIARDPAAQGFSPRSVDVILGLDVVHATPDVTQTLRHLESLLSNEGMLALIETVTPFPWIDAIWGLAEGWWSFTDARVHANSPLLSVDGWKQAFARADLGDVESYPASVSQTDDALIVARRGGRGSLTRPSVVARLEQLGARVLVATADVADAAGMRAVWEEAQRRFGAVHGVIHAAGATQREVVVNPIAETGRREIEALFRARVHGTQVLADLVRETPLDFCALISSNAATLGGLGLSGYAAATGFLDAFATAQRTRRGQPWISTNWDGWPTEDFTGRGSGFRTGIDQFAMSRDEAVSAFARAIAQPVGQLVVSAGDLQARLDRWTRPVRADEGVAERTGAIATAATTNAAASERSGTSSSPGAARAAFHDRPSLATAFVAPRTDMEQQIAAIWRELLGIDRIGVDDNFFDLDGDSLLGTRLIARIGRQCGVDLPFRTLFEQPTVAGLAREVGRSDRDRLAAASRAGGLPPIPRVPDRPDYELSHAQRRLWVLSQIDPTGIAYNIPLHQVLDGPLDRRALETAFTRVIARHEALRTTFPVIDGEPRQRVDRSPVLRLGWQDLSADSASDARARELGARHAAERFDLEHGPLLRATLLRLADTRHVLLCTIHHIVCDGVSLGVLTRELAREYDAAIAGTASGLPALPIQYRDFAMWQNAWLQHDAHVAAARDYWHRQLAAPLPVVNLPTDFTRPSVQTFRGREELFALDDRQTAALRALARDRQASLFMVLVAIVDVLLHRYTAQEDLIVGSPIAGRQHPDLEPQIGYYLNMLALRTRVRSGQSFASLVDRVRETATGAYDHQNYPFDRLVDELALDRDLARSPLFDVVVILQNQDEPPPRFGDARARAFFDHAGTSKYDLTFSFKQIDDRLVGGIEYNVDLFAADRIARMAQHVIHLVDSIRHNPAALIGQLALLSAEERAQVLADYADDARVAPPVSIDDANVIEAFARQVDANPAAIAASDDRRRLTRAELRDRMHQMARALRARGIGPGSLVGIAMPRSVDMLIAVLGVLEAGAGYVPLDPRFPEDRLTFMRQDANLACVLGDADVRASCVESIVPLRTAVAPSDVAYVLYTSGSTGRPKGVVVPHGALLNLLQSMSREPGLRGDDVLLAVTTLSFDIAALELLLPLICGAHVAIASSDDAADGRRLIERLRHARATVMQATPSTWQMLLEAGWQGDPAVTALCGGEALPMALARRLTAICPRVWNLYGPTETTVWSAVFDVTAALSTDAGRARSGGHEATSARAPASAPAPTPMNGHVAIGHPIAATSLAVLDRFLQPVPLGVPGELCIGGRGVAYGYLQRPDVTAERFVPDPFSATPGARLYRTGDLAVRRADGVVEFLGRLDDQIKLRGFRIEIGEIESALLASALVSRAAVVLQDHPAGPRLLAAVVTRPDAAIDVPIDDEDALASALRTHLRRVLPDYMVPDAFVTLGDLPQTPNGKIDRRALRALQADSTVAAARSTTAPRTPLEARLCAVWAGVLGLERVPVDASFFTLGGHSLAATRLAHRLRQEVGVDLGLIDIFEHPTVEAQARLVESRAGGGAALASIPVAPMTSEELEMLSE